MVTSMAFSVLAIVAAALAVTFSDSRKVILSAWVAGLSVGAVFLSYGAEYLAVVQWIVATLVAISFLVYATMFGEYGAVDSRSTREKFFDCLPALLVGGAFFGMIALAVYGQSPVAPVTNGPGQPNDLAAIGEALGERHLVALELVGFTLLALLIGVGVISRAETDTEGEGQ